ncbi:MAG: TonB-dependent receptor [Acidobacteriota bacterium]|nr:TonB-dependent receptor [Acidobacteriota bacterium]
MKLFACLVICLAGSIPHGFAQEARTNQTLTVYASKDETPIDRVNTNTIIITREEIERHQWQTVADVLQQTPGISLVRTGGDGALTTIFSRGAKSENTLVLLNGARLNDPSGVSRGFDFAHLSTHGVERVEIVLGPQNTLHGTDASAGVINIVTRQGTDEPEGMVGLELSDEETQRYQARVSGASGGLNYAVSAERYDAESISARGDLTRENLEMDAYDNTTLHAGLGYRFSEQADTNFHLSSVEGDSDIDAFDGDDPNYVSAFEQRTVSWNYRRDAADDRWDLGLYLDYTDTERTNNNEVDAAHPNDRGEGRFNGDSLRAELRARVRLGEHADLLTGASHEREDADGYSYSESVWGPFEASWTGDTDTLGVFAQVDVDTGNGFDADLGVRYNDHSLFGDETTYRAGAGYAVESIGTRFHASAATGFRAPSVYQLYSAFGNQQLLPENSEALELGFQTTFADGRGTFGAYWYQHEYEDLIEFFTDPVTFISYYINIDSAESEGMETHLGYGTDRWSVRLTYEILDADNTSDPGNPVPLIRRFEDKASFQIQGRPTADLHLFADVLFYGESRDTDFSSWPYRDVTLDSYTLLNLGARYQLNDSLEFKLRAENAADEEYTQILGYNTVGRRIFAGATWHF